VHIGALTVVRAFTQSEQQKEVNSRQDSANGSVISRPTFSSCSFSELLMADLKSRLHTRHLGGKTASRKMLKSDPGQLEVPDLAT
jgi:hypothetical protein